MVSTGATGRRCSTRPIRRWATSSCGRCSTTPKTPTRFTSTWFSFRSWTGSRSAEPRGRPRVEAERIQDGDGAGRHTFSPFSRSDATQIALRPCSRISRARVSRSPAFCGRASLISIGKFTPPTNARQPQLPGKFRDLLPMSHHQRIGECDNSIGALFGNCGESAVEIAGNLHRISFDRNIHTLRRSFRFSEFDNFAGVSRVCQYGNLEGARYCLFQ